MISVEFRTTLCRAAKRRREEEETLDRLLFNEEEGRLVTRLQELGAQMFRIRTAIVNSVRSRNNSVVCSSMALTWITL